MSPSEGLGDGEVAAVHKEIYGGRKGFTSQGVKNIKKVCGSRGWGLSWGWDVGAHAPREWTLGAGAEGACQVARGQTCHVTAVRVKLLSLRVKLSRPGPVEALLALVAWRNCELRSLRARGYLVQPRAPSKHLGPGRRCVEIDLAGCASAGGGRLSDCPLLAVDSVDMCVIDDTLIEGPILGAEEPGREGLGDGWMG